MSHRASHDPSARKVWRAAKQQVIDHYEAVLSRNGPTARGMEWKDEASQQLRFSILEDVCDLNGRSLHEVGAGAGHFFDYLAACAGEAHPGLDLPGLREGCKEEFLRLFPDHEEYLPRTVQYFSETRDRFGKPTFMDTGKAPDWRP